MNYQVFTVAQVRALTAADNYSVLSTSDYGGGQWIYDAADTSSSDNTGSILVTTDGKRYKRQYFITPEMFGAIGDGVADDTIALTAFFQAVNCKTGILTQSYFITAEIAAALSNCTIIGNNCSKITINNGYAILRLLDVSNVTITGISFVNNYNTIPVDPNAPEPVDNGSALVYSYFNNVKNLTVNGCSFTVPYARTSAISFYCNKDTVTDNYIDGLTITNCNYNNIRRIGTTIMNRTAAFDKCKNINISDNNVNHIGLLGLSDSIFLSLDGCGEYFKVNNNFIRDCYKIGIELVGGWNNGEVLNNNFSSSSSSFQYSPFSWQCNNSDYLNINNLVVSGNISVGYARNNFKNLYNCLFSNNQFIVSGDYAVSISASSGNKFDNDLYSSDSIYTTLISGTSTNNIVNNSKIINKATSGIFAIVRFSDTGTTNNVFNNCEIVKVYGAAEFDEVNTSGNVVLNKNVNNIFDSNYTLINFTADADITNTTVQQLNSSLFRINDSNNLLTQTRNIIFNNFKRAYVIRNTTGYPLGVKMAGQTAAAVIIPKNEIFYLYCDGAAFYKIAGSGIDGTWNIGTPPNITLATGSFAQQGKQIILAASVTTSAPSANITLPFIPEYGFVYFDGVNKVTCTGGSASALITMPAAGTFTFQLFYKIA
ncbi:hypothetical protein SAMN05192574_10671 [Mucilaginibacter gossypiicola]|uniref:Pectate lyase superfamily protein n=1 Tax=Mucilaginibacter gossypiicola TaxID=551995 RepID=A0A1H8MTL1_9SPHI|nr:hypothetical protein [Mucilaginibacter gossypiicola]SEO20553.1 hypothetical protein SAMN05192574_10671 [Mucilaginibacter gossypiicola]